MSEHYRGFQEAQEELMKEVEELQKKA